MERFNLDEHKPIAKINEELQKKFPYLVIFFFKPEVWGAQQKSGKKGFISGDEKLADVKTKIVAISKKISIDGNTEIGVLENRLMEEFGLIAQIGCSKKEGEFQYTNIAGDKRTLEEFSKKIEEAGYIKNPKPDCYKLTHKSDSSDKPAREKHKTSYNYMHPLS